MIQIQVFRDVPGGSTAESYANAWLSHPQIERYEIVDIQTTYAGNEFGMRTQIAVIYDDGKEIQPLKSPRPAPNPTGTHKTGY